MKNTKRKNRKGGAAVRSSDLVRRLPTRKEWKAITDAAGSPLPANVLWVINNWRWMCDALQACVQKYKLGGTGYNVARVVIEEIEATHQPPKLRSDYHPRSAITCGDCAAATTRPHAVRNGWHRSAVRRGVWLCPVHGKTEQELNRERHESGLF